MKHLLFSVSLSPICPLLYDSKKFTLSLLTLVLHGRDPLQHGDGAVWGVSPYHSVYEQISNFKHCMCGEQALDIWAMSNNKFLSSLIIRYLR